NSESRIFFLLQPPSKCAQTLVRAGDHLDTDDLADLGRSCCSRVSCSFDRGNIAAEKTCYITTANFFPPHQGDVSSFECRIACLEQRAKPFALDHSNRLLCHIKICLLLVKNQRAGHFVVWFVCPMNDRSRSSWGRAKI